MSIIINRCPDVSHISGICPVPAFPGFITSTNRYGTITRCDWGCCLVVGAGISGDHVTIDGTPYTAPSSWPKADACCDFGSGPVNCCEHNNPDSLTDGHVTFTALDECHAIITDATGSFSSLLGNITTIDAAIQFACDAFGNLPPPITIASDSLGYSDQSQFPDETCDICGNLTNITHNYPVIMGSPSPLNT